MFRIIRPQVTLTYSFMFFCNCLKLYIVIRDKHFTLMSCKGKLSEGNAYGELFVVTRLELVLTTSIDSYRK